MGLTDETKKPSDGEKKKRDAELDEFWDIDALIPKRRAPHYAANTETLKTEHSAPFIDGKYLKYIPPK